VDTRAAVVRYGKVNEGGAKKESLLSGECRRDVSRSKTLKEKEAQYNGRPSSSRAHTRRTERGRVPLTASRCGAEGRG